MVRAGKAGYNRMVLADYKFNILDWMPPASLEERVISRTAGGRI